MSGVTIPTKEEVLAGLKFALPTGGLSPRPLPENQLKPVPAFDHYALLPEGLRWWVLDEASRSAAPIEYVAVAGLVSACAIIAPKIKIQPKRHDSDYIITPNLWGAVIGMPSAKKTPGLKSGMRQLTAIEKAEQDRMATEARDFDKRKGMLEAKAQVCKEHYKKLLKKQVVEGEQSVTAADLEHAEAELMEAEAAARFVPSGRRYIINDATVEKLGEILQHSPGVLQFRDELTGWLNGLSREDRHNDRAFFLEAFNGNASYTYDRIGRGEVRIEHNVVSVLGGIQRDKIKPLVRAAVEGGEGNDGLLQRFQLMVYPDFDWREDEDRQPHGPSQEKAAKLFHKLATLPAMPGPIQLSEEAYPVFRQWSHGLQKRIASEDMHPIMQSHLGKYDKLCIGIAGVFAMIEWEPTQQIVSQVGQRHIEMAIRWCDFLEAHAERVYGLAESADLEAARVIVSRKDKLPDGFTLSWLTKSGWSGMSEQRTIVDALKLLIDYGQIYEVEVKTGGRPKTEYRWV
ncbi:MAG: YfjI family protein [Limimaricola soesokkakensis]|uniref:YfjI family protein n=1 Tax=Limimaricola soesokkakensis TaxID=1343159 RepID=UPI00405852C4